MPKANGAGLRVVEFIAANPGCDYATLCAGSGAAPRGGLVSHLQSAGRIFAAGPRGWRRYYPTADQAAAVHDELVRHAQAATVERKRRSSAESLRRRKALTRMLGTSRNTRPTQAVQGEPSASTFVVDGVRVQLAKRAQPGVVPSATAPTECRAWANAAVRGRAA